MIKGQDIAILSKLTVQEWPQMEQKFLAEELGMSQSEVSKSLVRLASCRLYRPTNCEVYKANFLEFIVHGIKYVFPAEAKAIGTGIPTAWCNRDVFPDIRSEEFPVWSHIEGTKRGMIIEPIYPALPNIALKDQNFYNIICAIDGIRFGRARETEQAKNFLKKKFKL